MGSSGMLERSTYTWFGISVHLFLGTYIFIYDVILSDPFIYGRFKIYDDICSSLLFVTCIDDIFSYTLPPNSIPSLSLNITYKCKKIPKLLIRNHHMN